MVIPLLISTLMHVALLVPLALPGCAGGGQEEEAEKSQRNRGASAAASFTVDIVEGISILPRKRHRSEEQTCGPDAIPEWYRFDIAPGAAANRIREVTRQSQYGLIIGSDFAHGKSSRALRGWFRPFDAVRLLAGDAGLCAVDWGDTIGVHPCYRSDRPFSRANEPLVRSEWNPPNCTTPTPLPGVKTRAA